MIRKIALAAILLAALAALVPWRVLPARATADERQVLALVLADQIFWYRCVAPMTNPDISGGTNGFATAWDSPRSRLLDRLDAWTRARDARLMVDPGKFPDMRAEASRGKCYSRSVLQTPRIGKGVAFVNVTWSPIRPGIAPKSSGSYALVRYPQGWRIVSRKESWTGSVN